MDVKNIRKQLAKFRDEAFGWITGLLKEMDIDELRISDFSSCPPVIREDKLNGDLTFTLDAIRLNDGRLSFDCSNCCENHSWGKEEIDTDTLVEIVHFLSNPDLIAAIKAEIQEERETQT